MHIIYDNKQESTFTSVRWGTFTYPNLCFVTKNQNGTPLSAQRRATNKFPKSQYRSVILDVGLALLRINKLEMKRWNLRKANCKAYLTFIDENINRIEPIPENYHRFVNLLKWLQVNLRLEDIEKIVFHALRKNVKICLINMSKMEMK